MRRLHGASVERSLMVTLGLLVILVGVATCFWGNPDVIRSVPAFFDNTTTGVICSVHLFGANGVTISDQQILTVAVAVAVAIGLRLLLPELPARRGHAGRGRRPRAGGHVGGQAVPHLADGVGPGLHHGRVGRGAAGPDASTTGLSIDQLTLLVINGYAAAVVGRLRNLPMTFLGAMALGLITEYCIGLPPRPHQPERGRRCCPR